MRRLVVVIALASAACFMDEATPGGADDAGSETGPTTTGSGSESESSAGPNATSTTTSTSATTMDTTPTDSVTTDTTPPETDTSPGECPLGEMCLPIGDGEWMGPIVAQVVAPDAPPPSCPNGWSVGPTGNLAFEPGSPTCSCNCPDEPLVTCEFQIIFDAGSDCTSGLLNSAGAGDGSCISYADSNAHSVIAYDITNSVDCGNPEADPLPPPTWGERIDACVPTLGEPCSLGACVPDPVGFPGSLCITHAGDVPCPEGPFDQPYVAHSGYDDNRMCGCSCSQAFVGCTGTLTAYQLDGCGNELISVDVGTCTGDLTEVGAAGISDAVPSAACIPLNIGGAVPAGQVTPTGPLTFCCTDP